MRKQFQGRSYTEMEPRRSAPPWARATPVRHRVTTDDAVFDLCAMTKSERNAGEVIVSWKDGRGSWRQAAVNKRRIRRVENLL
jgi:hypothetical protein